MKSLVVFVNMLASKRKIELSSRSKWMSCFVGLADSTVFEIGFSPQSDGLEILTKVSLRTTLYTRLAVCTFSLEGGKTSISFLVLSWVSILCEIQNAEFQPDQCTYV